MKKEINKVGRDAAAFSKRLCRALSIPGFQVEKKRYGNVVFQQRLANLYLILCDVGASEGRFDEVKKLARKGLSSLHRDQCPKKEVIRECPCLFVCHLSYSFPS